MGLRPSPWPPLIQSPHSSPSDLSETQTWSKKDYASSARTHSGHKTLWNPIRAVCTNSRLAGASEGAAHRTHSLIRQTCRTPSAPHFGSPLACVLTLYEAGRGCLIETEQEKESSLPPSPLHTGSSHPVISICPGARLPIHFLHYIIGLYIANEKKPSKIKPPSSGSITRAC